MEGLYFAIDESRARRIADAYEVLPIDDSHNPAVRRAYHQRHLYFFQGGDAHPLLGRVDPATGLSMNDKFRAIHDLFGHAAEGYSFGPRGEENAWIRHSQMFSAEAQRAVTSETRGQNSWVNYGRHNYDSCGNHSNRPLAVRPYATQKAALLPTEFMDFKLAIESILEADE
jgi:hypothetical protein